MPGTDITKIASTLLPWFTTAVGWILALLQWRKKRKAEAELKLIRRRGDAPYLIPSDSTFDRLLTDASPREARTAHPHTVLSVFHTEVPKDTPAATPIRLVVDNQGKLVRRVSVTLDAEPIQLRSEPALEFASGLQFLQYPYDPKKHGQDQTLVITFESTSGVQDKHTYRLKHGVRQLTRTDPP